MKRIKAALLALCLLAALSGCGAQKIEAAADEFVLAVSLESQEPVYRLSCEYFLFGELMGGMSSESADGSAMREETYAFRFSPELFPEDADRSGFSAVFYITAEPGAADLSQIAAHIGQSPVQGEIVLSPENGSVYPVLIRGDGGRFTASIAAPAKENS